MACDFKICYVRVSTVKFLQQQINCNVKDIIETNNRTTMQQK